MQIAQKGEDFGTKEALSQYKIFDVHTTVTQRYFDSWNKKNMRLDKQMVKEIST